jgi:branched-chain amino acid transport system ATP-binding protein
MLDVQNVVFSYGAQPALQDASLSIGSGEFVSLLGANGAGKTTLLRTISGLLKPAAGAISLDGRRLERLSSHRICELGLIHVPEGRQLFPQMTVHENLELGAYLPEARRRLKTSLEFVIHIFPKLAVRSTQLAGTLSGGEQQMVAIGRGLMACPRLLMLDEPTLGLAPLLANEILQAVKRWKDESRLTVLLVSQEIVQSLQLATRAYVMENGRVVRQGTGEQLLHDDEVRVAYLGI